MVGDAKVPMGSRGLRGVGNPRPFEPRLRKERGRAEESLSKPRVAATSKKENIWSRNRARI